MITGFIVGQRRVCCMVTLWGTRKNRSLPPISPDFVSRRHPDVDEQHKIFTEIA